MKLASRMCLVVFAGMLPLAAAEAWNSYTLHRQQRDELGREAQRQAYLAASEIDRVLEGVWGVTNVISTAPVVQRKDQAGCSEFLRRILPNMPYIKSLATADKNGVVFCAVDSSGLGTSIADRPYFQAAVKQSGNVIGEYIIGKINKVPLLPMATAIKDVDGQTVGVAVATLNLGWLSEQLAQRGLPDGGSITVADRNGTVIARQPYPDRFIGTKIPDQYLYLLNEETAGSIEVKSQDGTQRILGYLPLSMMPRGLYVSAGLSTENSFAALRQSDLRQLGFWLLTMCISLAGAFVASTTFIQKPLSRITNALRRVQQEDLSARTHMKAGDGELDYIGSEIDQTISKLQARDKTVSYLMAELQHRGKNQIALVAAMARQLARSSNTVAEFAEALTQRLNALAASQNLLSQSDGSRFALKSVLNAQLQVFTLQDDQRITADDRDIDLDARAARNIGMAFHELLTNALKHGALSRPAGRVSVIWQTLGADQICHLTWSEHGGPPTEARSRTGFGSVLLEKIIPAELNGTSQLLFVEGRCQWELTFPLIASTEDNVEAAE